METYYEHEVLDLDRLPISVVLDVKPEHIFTYDRVTTSGRELSYQECADNQLAI